MKSHEMITVELIDKSDMDQPRNKFFNWKIASYEPFKMKIQLEFEEPLNVSSYKFDEVNVNFARTNFIFDTWGQRL